MHRVLLLCTIAATTCLAQPNEKPLRVLLVTGGCCHDYGFQTKAMQKAARDRKVAIDWTVVNDGGRGTAAQIALYDKPDWAKGFDVVVHNECFANTTDSAYIRRISEAHKAGANAVVIHCAMHTYRSAKTNDWREFLGVTSRRHDHQSRYPVKVDRPAHPIMQGFPANYRTPMDELYIIEKVWPTAQVLATSPSERDGQLHPVFWTNRYGKARVFGTTYGHSNATFEDPVFLDTLLRGIRWAAGRLPAKRTASRFDEWDRNNDGTLSRDELPARLRRNFAVVDRNRDGVITRAEDAAFRRAETARGANRLSGLTVFRDVAYADTDNPRQTLDIALPKSADGPLPVIAFIHGGGWRNGNKNGGLNRVASFVRSGRFAGVSIGYRLSGEARWPAQIHDCKAAIRFLKANAQKYGFDAERIGVYGTSAGGHLVAMLGTTGNVAALEGDLGQHTHKSSRVHAVANYYGPSDLLSMNDFPSRIDHNAANSPESLLIGTPIQDAKRLARAASPISYVSSDDAPMLLVHGDADPLVPFNQSEILHAALRKAGTSATLVRVRDGGHGGFQNPKVDELLEQFFAVALLGEKGNLTDTEVPNSENVADAPK